MRLKKSVHFLLLGIVAAADQEPKNVDLEETSRQLNSRDSFKLTNDRLPPIRDTIKEYLHKKRKQDNYDYNYDAYSHSLNEIETGPPDQISMESSPQKVESQLSQNKNSPALSALALLGFLYFLNLIQGTSIGRKKREISQYLDGTENLNDYLYAIEDLIKKVSNILPKEEGGGEAEARGINDITSYFYDPTENPSTDRAFRVVSYLGSLLAKIPEVLGFTPRASSRNDDFSSSYSDKPSGGFWSLFGRRIGLVARIMDFLSDPSPSRVGRARYDTDRTEADPHAQYAEPVDLSEEDKEFLPYFARDGSHSRTKRFAEDEMNIWYSEAKDPNYGKDQTGSNQFLGMVLNLVKQALVPS